MKQDVQIVVRMPAELAKQADRVYALMQKSDRYRAAGLSRAAVYRIAIDRGLASLRAELESSK